jgi:hypothetical protein
VRASREPFNTLRAYVAVRGGERYIAVLDIANKKKCTQYLRTLGQWASNPELSFEWTDAALGARALRFDIEAMERSKNA